MGLSSVTIAIPVIEVDLDFTAGGLQFVLSSYALVFGAFLLMAGRLSDIFGHRRILLLGMSIFSIGTIACGVSQSSLGLLVARGVQGFGAAFSVPPAQAHIGIYFPDPKERAMALGWWGAAGSLGFLFGLILGGVLTSTLGWRWVSTNLSCVSLSKKADCL